MASSAPNSRQFIFANGLSSVDLHLWRETATPTHHRMSALWVKGENINPGRVFRILTLNGPRAGSFKVEHFAA
jgi:hypothetical protein